MKILRQDVNEKIMSGTILMQAEEEEDMYHLYNLIQVGDVVEASTMRNVVTESKSGVRDKTRVMTKIAVKVDDLQFDAEQGSLRVKGINVKENENLKLGQSHTLTLELNRPCELFKEFWDSISLDMLRSLSEPVKKAELAVLVMQDGLANLLLLREALTKHCAKIERALQKKKTAASSSSSLSMDTAVLKFFSDVYDAIMRHVDFNIVKVVLVGSPGFVKDDFMKYLHLRAVQEGNTVLIKNKSKFIVGHTSSGQRRAVEELLSEPGLAQVVGDVKAADEVKVLQQFYNMLSTDPDRACYGVSQVLAADGLLAVADLLITDTMYRTSDFVLRNKYVALVESVKRNGGKVFHFSSLHVSGEQLNLYSGVAAILRFPVPDIEEEEEEEEKGEVARGAPISNDTQQVFS
jgi:protein pelota